VPQAREGEWLPETERYPDENLGAGEERQREVEEEQQQLAAEGQMHIGLAAGRMHMG
jgi:hypothetical protein